MNEIFVCGRTYDVYISLVYSLSKNKKIILVLSKKLPNQNELINRLKSFHNVIDVILVNDDGLHEGYFFKKTYGKIGLLLNLLSLRFKMNKVYSKELELDKKLDKYIRSSTMNLFFVNSALKIFCYRLSGRVRFIEEGLGIYSKKYNRYYLKLYNLLGLPEYNGNQEKVFEVLLSKPSEIDIFDKNKKIQLSVSDFEKNLSLINKKEIINVFDVFMGDVENKQLGEGRGKLILITQPLSEDGHMSEDEKIKLYSEVINKYKHEYNIFLKKHPRELTDYTLSYIDKSITHINQDLPVDVLNLREELYFDLGVTVSSTGLNNFTRVGEKIFLIKDFCNVTFDFEKLLELVKNE